MEKPILFSTPMVQAIVDGRKSQTRRIIKPQPELCHGCHSCYFRRDHFLSPIKEPCRVGDVLWVREKWALTNSGDYIYAANYCPDRPPIDLFGNYWKPSIHMPKSACRIKLQIIELRIERLQDISLCDAECEGVQPMYAPIYIPKTAFIGLCRTLGIYQWIKQLGREPLVLGY